jgi:hypothetical protein
VYVKEAGIPTDRGSWVRGLVWVGRYEGYLKGVGWWVRGWWVGGCEGYLKGVQRTPNVVMVYVCWLRLKNALFFAVLKSTNQSSDYLAFKDLNSV